MQQTHTTATQWVTTNVVYPHGIDEMWTECGPGTDCTAAVLLVQVSTTTGEPRLVPGYFERNWLDLPDRDDCTETLTVMTWPDMFESPLLEDLGGFERVLVKDDRIIASEPVVNR